MSQKLTDQTIRIRKKIMSWTQYFSKEINERGSLGNYSLVKKAHKCCFRNGAVPVRNFLSYLETLDKVVKIILIILIELCILLIQQDVDVFCSACSWPHINCTKPFAVMWRHGLWMPLWSTWLSVGFKKAREGQKVCLRAWQPGHIECRLTQSGLQLHITLSLLRFSTFLFFEIVLV